MKLLKPFISVTLILLLTACHSAGDISMKENAIKQISAGMSEQEVIDLLGDPGVTFQRTPEIKTLNYCSTGLVSDTYYSVVIKNSIVTGIESKPGQYVDGSCGLVYSQANQFNTKSPEVKCLEYGFKKGTKDYGSCMMEQERMAHESSMHNTTLNTAREIQRQEHLHDYRKSLSQPQPISKGLNCTSTTHGNMTNTNCY